MKQEPSVAGPGSFRHYFLDWDGCVANTLPFWLAGYRAALTRRGLNPPDQVILRELFNDWDGPGRFGVPDPRRFTDEVAGFLHEHAAEVQLNPHIREVLARLKGLGKTAALLTASHRRLVLPELARKGLEDLLGLVLTVEDVRRYKPDPEVVFTALGRLGAQPGEALFVGDSDKDIQAARAAGVAMALYLPEHNRPFYDVDALLAMKPQYVIADFRELLPDTGEAAAAPG